MTALLPLNQQDMIWLEVADQLDEERRIDDLKTEYETRRAFALILQDIRVMVLNLIPFNSDMAFKDFLTKLPSYDGDAENQQREHRWKVKKRNPGEVPEWKRRKMAERSQQNATTASIEKKAHCLLDKSKVASESL